jgi:hypothetical protein
MKHTSTRRAAAAALLLALALAGCSKLKVDAPTHSNPVDPDIPGYVEPGVQLTAGPSEGGSVTTASVTFRWRGLGAAQLFRYNLDAQVWSGWSADTSVTISSLAEGPHRLQLQAADGGGYQGSATTTRNFTMNRYSNTVMIYPLAQTVHVGDTVQFVCELEDMGPYVSAVEMVMYMQTARLDTVGASADTGYHWRGNGGSPVGPLFTNYGTNYLQVALGVAGGSPAGVRNTGRIFKIKARAMSVGSASVQMISLNARDTLNQAVTTTLPPSSTITILAK